MSLVAATAYLLVLLCCATAFPAGPGVWLNGTSPLTSDALDLAAYSLIDSYDASNWLGKFDVQDISDPTHGFVDYVNAAEAQQLGLMRSQNNQMYMGVDTWSYLDTSGSGRKSVRVQSKTSYNKALIIADFAHVPASACGTWPAFWMVGPGWPSNGEFDIYEGVNVNTYNQVTLHTSPDCSPKVGPGGENGYRINNIDCGADGGYDGCGVVSYSSTSYGSAFNSDGGGVYASLWTSSGILVWHFPSWEVPANIRGGNPDPSTWGTPMANFGGGGCDFDAMFRDMSIVFDIAFCGDCAGGAWSSSTCSQRNPSCWDYVASQPQSFWDTYWLINSIKVYSV
ncbi:endo-1,3(4)-beta-glucanase-like protein [Phaeosphaeria sp. MPI-PUGE-AT-0046c]|nr:endo-1,3(4)-beta-glucanase-like protein [Phaeosphaeria sp. MPI-PUGE-AT-0046c]